MDLAPDILVFTSPDQEFYVADDSILIQMTLSAIEGLNTLEVDHLSRNIPLVRIGETDFQSTTSSNIAFYYVVDSTEKSGDTALISFTVIDNRSLADSELLEYKVAEEIDTFTRIFGDQINPNFGNCLSIQDQKIYTLAEGLANPEKIDFLFYYDSVFSWTLIGPNAGFGNDSLISELSNFSVRRDTRFDRGIFNSSFSNLVNDGPIVEIDSIPQRRYIDSISSGSTFYFLTAEDLRGVIQMRSFQDSLGNFGTLEVKVQR